MPLRQSRIEFKPNHLVCGDERPEHQVDARIEKLNGLRGRCFSLCRAQISEPIIGTAFKGQDDIITRKEIIFLLTPTLIEDKRLWQMGEDGLEILDAVQLGSRSGLLPFSRDQLTADYNRDAIDAYRAGDLDRALYFANNSLRTSSLQPEMVRLRDTLSRSTRQAWQRSMHKRLIDGELTPGRANSNEANDLQSVPDTDAVDVGSLKLPTLDPQGDGFGTAATSTVAAVK